MGWISLLIALLPLLEQFIKLLETLKSGGAVQAMRRPQAHMLYVALNRVAKIKAHSERLGMPLNSPEIEDAQDE